MNSVQKIYDPYIHPHQTKRLCEMGMTNREIADFFQVSVHTIHRWRANYPEFAEAFVTGKELADDRVERALYNRAIGYSYDSEKIVTISLGKNAGTAIERVPIVEHVPPDVKAAELWLKNRRPKEWGGRVADPGEGEDTSKYIELSPVDYSELTQDEALLLHRLLSRCPPDTEPGAAGQGAG